MKRPLVALATVLSALLAAAPAAAQGLRLGAEVGLTLSTFSGGGAGGLDHHRSGFTAGVTAAYRIGEVVDVESGLLWIQKGAEGSIQGFEEPIEADVRLSYLQVPVLLRVTPFAGRAVRPSFSAGPVLSFETRCRMEHEPGTLAMLIGCEDDGRARADLGLRLGAGLAWRLGRAEVLLDGRYELGFRDLDTVDALDTRHRGFTLTPRLSLPLGR